MTNKHKIRVLAGAGGGGGDSNSPVEDPDTLQSRAMISVLDLLGEGVIGGLVAGAKSIYLDGTRVQNADGTYNFDQSGFSYEERKGTQLQNYVTAFSSVETPHGVGVRVRKDLSHSIYINNPNTDRVRIIMNFPALIQQDSGGNVHGTEMGLEFYVKRDNDAFVLAATSRFKGKSRSKYQRSYVLNLPKPATSWVIKIARGTADSTDAALANESWVDSYTEITNLRLSYPNSALVGLKLNSEFFNGVPSRSYLVDGLFISVPSNYNEVSRTYSGMWDGTFKPVVSNNPAWVLYDILTNKRYGLGNYISPSQIDKAKLYQIGKYCDEMVSDGRGGIEPRFTVNTVVANRVEAYRLVADLCAVFRGMAYWSGSFVSVVNDAPTDPTMIFSQANVVDGEFTYMGTARRERHSVVHVTWNDPTEDYAQKIEYVEDQSLINKFGVRKVELMAFGCTSRGQAHRVGLWTLYTEQFESDTVAFKTGMDAAMLMPGEVVKIHDKFRAGKRMAGRIQSCTTTSVTLDSPVTLSTSGALITLRREDGTIFDVAVSNGAGTHATLNFSTAISGSMPMPNSMFVVREPNLKPMLARVVSVQPDQKGVEFAVVATEHNPDKFAAIEQGLKLEDRQITIIDPNKVTKPSNLTAAETPVTLAPGVMGISLDVSWEGQEASFSAAWRKTAPVVTNWQRLTTSVNGFMIDNVSSGTYEIAVSGVNFIGVQSEAAILTKSVVADAATPADVTGLYADSWVTKDCKIHWEPVTFAKDYLVEVWAADVLKRSDYVKDLDYTYSRDTAVVDGGPWRSLTFKVKARSYQGTLSNAYATVTATNPQIAALESVSIDAGYNSLNIAYTILPADVDFAGVKIWIGTTAGFTPAAGNMVYDGSDQNITVLALADNTRLVGGTTYYMKIAGYDAFGKDNMTPSAAYSFMPYSVAGGISAGEISAAMIAAGVIDSTKFATGIEPVSIVASLPNPTGYAGPKVVLYGGKIYRYSGGAWSSGTDAADVVGNFTPAKITTKLHMIV